jgi:hypothetical protein
VSWGEVKLKPGVSVDWTPTLNEAGISQSQLIRFRDSLVQKYGGWSKFYPFAVSGTPRDLHAWQDLNAVDHLAVGTTASFNVITGSTLQNITPQTLLSNFSPNFSTVNTTPTVTVNDPNIATVTTFDSVFFNTPVTIGGIILSGLYPIVEVTGTTTYQITAETNATATVNNAGAVPVFTPTTNSAVVSVAFANHGMVLGDIIALSIPTTGDGVTISGSYPATTITDANDFQIQVATQATGNTALPMNGGLAQLVYYIAIGPPAGGVGYGIGGYGLGGYGTGVAPVVQTGTNLAASDWTSDNWGELILGCPAGGGIYYWDPTGGFINMSLVSSGPAFNSGIFVSTSAQILIAFGSCLIDPGSVDTPQIGIIQDPMLISWSDSGNFLSWIPTDANFAGNYLVPIGSQIMAGVAGPANQNLIWTDLDLWAMNFIGQPDVYGFTQIGAGAGACGRHAVQKLRGGLYWMGTSNFYVYNGGGVSVVPCPVWDAVFQNFNTAFAQNVRAMPNTPFNEAGWLYPSNASVSGENDSYAKFNITDPSQPWDYGLLARSAWIDLSVLGNPIAATPSGVIYRQESGPDADGQPLVAGFTTAYFYLSEGEDFVSVDKFYPDFIWQVFPRTSTSAQIQVTFNVLNYPGDTPRTFGPFTVTQATKYVDLRFRGRQVSMTFQSSDVGSFWRLGKCRFRFSTTGRQH